MHDDRPFYWHYPHYDESTPYSSAIIDRWKVIRYADFGKVELYHLAEDPMETKDLVAYHPEKAVELLHSLDKYLVGVDAQHALPNPDYDPNEFSGGIRSFSRLQTEPNDIHGARCWEASRKTN